MMLSTARKVPTLYTLVAIAVLLSATLIVGSGQTGRHHGSDVTAASFDRAVAQNLIQGFARGREEFRFDTFGDEAFWGGQLGLHQAIEGAAAGGVGAGLSPRAALGLGLKVDAERLPRALIRQIRLGQVNLDDPRVTLALLRLDAVVGVAGFFQPNGSLKSVGIRCALCHSTVDDSVAPGIGGRLDGWANRDLNVGAIISLAPTLKPFTDLLKIVNPSITDADVRSVLATWGPGKFDAELILDGKAFNPDSPLPNKSAATLIPTAFGLAGFNNHTWTGGWGTVTYWNAFVANLEMHGVGNFFDVRLDNAAQFPIAAAAGLGHIVTDADSDRITKNLGSLQNYQLALPAPKPAPGVDFDPAAAARGDELFGGKAKCGTCHKEPLWTEPGWNTHKPEDIKIESFQADRSPDKSYKTMNLAGLFIREEGIHMSPANKGRYYHDGRFQTLTDVVNSYNTRLSLGLAPQEVSDLVQYLRSL